MNSKKKLNIADYLEKKDVKRFSIFFAIAFVFLIFSKLSNDYKQTLQLKIHLTNIEDETIFKEDSLNTMTAIVEAKGFALIPFIFKNSRTIILDAKTDVTKIDNHYIFDVNKHRFIIEGQLGSSYKLLSVKPDTLTMSYSKRASKRVPVILKTDIEFASGFDVRGDFAKNVDSVKVVGSSDSVAKISSIPTLPLSLKKINSNVDENLLLDVPMGVEVFPKSIQVKGMVKRFTEGTIEVPVTIKNKPSSIEINFFPKTVTLSYYVDLDSYGTILASDFAVECDFGELKEDQAFFVPKIAKQPESIKRINIKQKRIDFIKL